MSHALSSPYSRIVALIGLFAVLLTFAPAPPAQAAGDEATISGTVVKSDNAPIAGAEVTAYDSGGDAVGWATTDLDGDFTVESLGAGGYRIGISAPGFLEWYSGDKGDLDDAAVISLAANQQYAFPADIVLQRGRSLSGSVTGATGVDLSGASVTLYTNKGGSWEGDQTVDLEGGEYTFFDVRPGTYRIGITLVAYWSIPELFVGNPDMVTDVGLAADVVVGGSDVDRDISLPLGKISGTVTDDDDDPILGVDVSALDADGNQIGSVTTGEDGTYAIWTLAQSGVRIQFDGSAAGYDSEYYDDQTDFDDANTVTVTPVATVTADATLTAPQYVIRGRVTAQGAGPLGNVEVTATVAGTEVSSMTTGPQGRYSLTLYDEADVVVGFAADGFDDQWYNGADDPDDATPVHVGPSTPVVKGIDATLTGGGLVTGTITDTDDQPIAGVVVTAVDADTFEDVARTTTAVDGTYVLGVVGSVLLRFGGTVPEQWYDGADGPWDAEAIPVASGQTVTIDINVDTAGAAEVRLTGTVRDAHGDPIVGAEVSAGTDDYWDQVTTNGRGQYAFVLAPGTYDVNVSAPGYLDAEATVELDSTPEQTRDFTLEGPGHIAGTVQAEGGAPLAGADVTICDEDYGCRTKQTKADGTFSIAALPGKYTVEVGADGYISEYYDDVRGEDNATLIDVVSDATTTLPNTIQLAQAVTVTGTITDSATPVAGAKVRLLTPNRSNQMTGWREVRSVNSAANGAYTFDGLDKTVRYRIKVDLGARTQTDSSDLAVGGGGTITHDIALLPARHVGGHVFGDSGGLIAKVTVQRKETNRFGKYYWDTVASPTTGADGAFDVPVSPGIYRLQAQDQGGLYFLGYYTGNATPVSVHVEDHQPVDVRAADALGLELHLVKGGQISGHVTINAVTATTGWVDLYSVSDDWVTSAEIKSDGSYSFTGLADGAYTIEVSTGSGYVSFADQLVIDPTHRAVAFDPDLAFRKITGTFRDSSDNTPVPYVAATLEQKTGEEWGYAGPASADGSGQFEVHAGPGVYRIHVDRSMTHEAYTSAEITVVGSDVALGALNLVKRPAYAVTGTVSASGAPVKDAWVLLCPYYGTGDNDWSCGLDAPGTATDESGHYAFEAPDGRYHLYVSTDDYATSETDLTVAGAPVGQNVALVALGTISGTVTGPGGSALDYVEVTVYRWVTGSYPYWAYTNGDYSSSGTYSVQVPPGSYRVCFRSAGMVSECFDNAASVDDDTAQTLSVTPGGTATANAELAKALTLSGQVTDATSHVGVDGIRVAAFAPAAGGSGWRQVNYDATDDDGTYSIELPSGTYRLQLTDPSHDYPLSVYKSGGHAVTLDAGSDVPVNGADVTQDISIVKGGSIAGTITWPDVDPSFKYGWRQIVRAYDATGNVVGQATVTSDSPYYAMMGLESGSYRLDFARFSGMQINPAEGQYFSNRSENHGLDGAPTLAVTSGGVLMDKDAVLQNGSVLSSRVVNGSGQPAVSCVVTADTADGSRAIRGSYLTDASGHFTLPGLSTGNYRLAISGGDCDDGVLYLTNETTGATGAIGSAATVAMDRTTSRTLPHDIVYASLPPLTPGTVTITGASTGGPLVGDTLTANEGTWASGVSFTYQWNAAGDAIAGATSKTFKVTSAQDGEVLTVTVTGHKAGSADTSTTSAATAAVKLPKITNTGLPVINGSAVVGATLTATAGTWSPNTGLTFSYEWKRDGTTVQNSAASTYTLTSGDETHTITVTVTASATDHVPGSATSASKGPVGPAATAISHTGALAKPSGTAKVGMTLTVATGTLVWNPADVTVSYQWFRGGATATGATGATYVVGPDDVGLTITVKATATKTGLAADEAVSPPTASVADIDLANTGLPTVSGTTRVGYTLTANPGTWSKAGATYGYTWLRNGIPTGRTGSTYPLGSADVGKQISVTVTATLGPEHVPATSTATAPVQAGLIKAGTVRVTGTYKVKKKLTVKVGATSPAGVTVKYQWLRAGKAIAKATKTTYTLIKKDKSKKVNVKVTWSKPGYATVTKTSTAKKVK